MSSVKLLSPAKVNLFLRILGKRPDGYHEIQSILQPVSLFDEISISVETGNGVSLSGSGRAMPSGKDNLAVAACCLYLETSGLRKEVSVAIRKNIPLGAGLGGEVRTPLPLLWVSTDYLGDSPSGICWAWPRLSEPMFRFS